jgi:hypothetical protein
MRNNYGRELDSATTKQAIAKIAILGRPIALS